MPAGLQFARGDIALTLTTAGAGATSSGPLAASGEAAVVLVMVHTSAATGTGPTLTVVVEQSENGSTGWAAVPGASSAALAGVGNATVSAIPTQSFVRVTATVAGTTPAVTAKVAVVVFGD